MRLANEVQASYKHSIDRMHVDTLAAYTTSGRGGGDGGGGGGGGSDDDDTAIRAALPPPPPTPSAYRLAMSINDDLNHPFVRDLRSALDICSSSAASGSGSSPPYSFPRNRAAVAAHLTYGNPHIVPAMQLIRGEVMKIARISFLCGMDPARAVPPTVPIL